MEGVETVDVSWLHHSQKDTLSRTKSLPPRIVQNTSETSPSRINGSNPLPPPPAGVSNGYSPASAGFPPTPLSKPLPIPSSQQSSEQYDVKTSPPHNSSVHNSITGKPTPPRPIPSRRNSWISSLSSKFSSSSTPPSQTQVKDLNTTKNQPQSPRNEIPNPFGAAVSPKDVDKASDPSNISNSGSPRNSSFIHNAIRKLSSSGAGSLGRLAPTGVVTPRRVMNINSERDRCKIPDLDQSKLRRVAFCVDVEIAGTGRRPDSDDDKNGSPKPPSSQAESISNPVDSKGPEEPAKSPTSNADDDSKAKTSSGKELTKKQEKKKKSEEERKERREKKRRQAEENGSVPIPINMDDGSSSTPRAGSARSSYRGQDQPTTDPIRIYRRCCQLRETGVLKKVVEQISSPSSILAESPGTVAVLDLSDFRMTLTDIITFSDWLSIVPVRKLILDNCGLSDEAVRVILGGLLATKTIEAARQARKRKYRSSPAPNIDKNGAIEKLSLKGNPDIGPEGWRHICLFIHMSRSIKGIDLSSIPFPRHIAATNGPPSVNTQSKPVTDIATTFAAALTERFGGHRLEELVLSECSPSTEDLQKICTAARAIEIRRLGLANNNITKEGLKHVVGYLQGGFCGGLDLGGNDLGDHIDILATGFNETLPLTALSLADCSLTPKSLCKLMQSLLCLPSFRFIDLSHNKGLFSTQPDSLSVIRKYLPQLPDLRRIHLADVCLTPNHAIAIAEIIPDCPKLCHIHIMENPRIQALASATTPGAQEEACALYASYMAAARISRTLVAVDIEVPTPDNNEVVKALASQIIAYSLRNLQHGELKEELSSTNDVNTSIKEVPVPDILAHLVGHSDDSDTDADDLHVAADEDYVIGGTGVVRALGVCLGNTDYGALEGIGEASPSASGTSTPIRRLSQIPVHKKPRDMSRDLLNSARKIRQRLQPILVREDKAGNDLNYRRLFFLDMTLQRTIQRFEDEFPETRLPDETATTRSSEESPEPSQTAHSSVVETSEATCDPEADVGIDDDDRGHYAVRLSRTSSNTSLHSRALTHEEGRVHRLSQHFNRDILQSELDNTDKPSFELPHDDDQIIMLREKLERLRAGEDQAHMFDDIVDKVGDTSLEDLLALQKRDPEAFAELKENQIVTLINAGLRSPDGTS
ncbi:hypothetical protein FQN57_004420 [Myotisia sp. PD_48]|nr:hypothetical protein FQN57_004420 [Myotisia sp. PD_48]